MQNIIKNPTNPVTKVSIRIGIVVRGGSFRFCYNADTRSYGYSNNERFDTLGIRIVLCKTHIGSVKTQ